MSLVHCIGTLWTGKTALKNSTGSVKISTKGVNFYLLLQILCRDQSGSINHTELQDALSSFGYNLSQTVYSLLIRKFDRTNKQAVKFDDFIQCCLVLHVSQILRMKI